MAHSGPLHRIDIPIVSWSSHSKYLQAFTFFIRICFSRICYESWLPLWYWCHLYHIFINLQLRIWLSLNLYNFLTIFLKVFLLKDEYFLLFRTLPIVFELMFYLLLSIFLLLLHKLYQYGWFIISLDCKFIWVI